MRLTALLAALCLTHATAADIILTAQVSTVFEEGGTLKRVKFSDGQNDYSMSLDSETTVERLQNGTRFTFQPLRTAAFDFLPSPLARERTISPTAFPELQKIARSLVPREATQIEPDAVEVPNPLQINDWKSYRVTFTYKSGASPEPNKICITFLTLENGQQVLLSTMASEREFAAAMGRSDYMIRSWYAVHQSANSGS